MLRETTKIGRRGAVVIPAALRRRFGLSEGDVVIAEDCDDGVLIRPAVALPVEVYSRERRAELLLNNALPGDDYERALAEVRKLGLDPDTIPHERPDGQ